MTLNMTNHLIPYADLEPSLILAAIESVGFQCNGSLLALNSYENRVYQVGMDDAPPVIAKFYRPHRWSNEAILEEHQFALELMANDIPVVAPIQMAEQTLHEYQGYRFAVFTRQGGRALELDNMEHLEWMGRFIGRLHAMGATKIFQHRLRLDVDTYGRGPYQFLIENNFIPTEIKANYCQLVDILLNNIEQAFAQSGPISYIRLHGDCHAGNVLWNNAGPQIVDLDDCLMGPAVQDIWMLLSGESEYETRSQLDRILKGYEAFHDFNYAEYRLIEALRSLRMLHYSAWLAKRWTDPAFPPSFPWFNTLSYWKEHLFDIDKQVQKLEE